MDERELRIGNWVKWPNEKEPNEVQWEFGHYIGIYKGNYGYPVGIELNEEWLLRFGFSKVEESPFDEIKLKYWVNNRICLFFNESPPYNTYLVGWADQRFGKYSVVTGDWIETVHRLQNIFHALTNSELTLKEKL